MSNRFMFTVSILPALVIMPVMADVIDLNEQYNSGELSSINAKSGQEKLLNVDDIRLSNESIDDVVYANNAKISLIGKNIDISGGKYDVIYAGKNGHVDIQGGSVSIKSETAVCGRKTALLMEKRLWRTGQVLI